jgi:GT2 family glycosyltransferase
MTSHFPLVSIITVNYNQTQVTRELLHSLRMITYPAVEIFVVDNGSPDDSISSLALEFPEIELIMTGKNLGFAGGNNVALRRAKGDFCLLINNDLEVTAGFLEPLVETLTKNARAGLASPKILYFERSELIQYAGATRISAFTGRGKKIGHLQPDNGQFDSVRNTDLGHGACLLISRRVINAIGLLPEEYFLYYEEHDFTEKAKSNGFEVYYVGTSKVYHKESISIGKNSPLKTFYQTRNRILYIKRNSSFATLIISLVFFLTIAVPKQMIRYLIQKDTANLRAYLRGIFSHVNYSKI